MAYNRESKPRTCRFCGATNLTWRRDASTTFKWKLQGPDGVLHACLSAPTPEPAPSAPKAEAAPAPEVPADPGFNPTTETEADEAPEAEADTPAPAPAPGSLEATILGLIDARVTPSLAKVRKDVKRLIATQASQAPGTTTTTTLRVEVTRVDGTQHTVEGAHKQFASLLRAVAPLPIIGRVPPLLFGKPGSSKSHSAKAVADALGLSFASLSLTPQTPESRLFGLVPLPGQPVLRTAFMDAVENGGVFLLDELDFGPPALLGTLNSLLANRFASFPAAGRVPVHPDFVLIATANTPGRGGAVGHETRRPLDVATLDRFAVIEWQYDEDAERNLTAAINPKAAAWAEWIGRVRAFAKDACPGLLVSPRSSYYGAGLLGAGFEPDAVAEMVLFRGIDPVIKAKVLAACPLPVGQ